MLDPNVKKNLMTAVDLAVGSGECKYVIDGKPGCVVAQFMALNGVSVEEMGRWESMPAHDLVIQGFDLFGASGTLLQNLQSCWDARIKSSEDETRTKMRALIEEADRA